ncbi:MAG: Gfo/Idh/MocA family oxidoreductase [Pseudomonadota bacterium]
MTRLNVASVGAGAFGRHHARHLAAHPNVATLTVIDADLARATAVAAEHGARAATTIAPDAMDAAIIAAPTEAHAALALPFLTAGRPVFIEKPIAQTKAEADRLIAAAVASGTFIQVGHIERFSAAFEALAGAVYKPRHIVATRHNPPRATAPKVDVVRDLMIHDIDLALAIAGAPVDAVSATALAPHGQEAARATLTFANGVVADLSASRLSPSVSRTLTVYDAAGVLHADLAVMTVTRTAQGAAHTLPVAHGRDNLAVELDEFLRVVAGEGRPRVDGLAGRAALGVADRVRAAIATAALKLSA